MNQPFMRVPIYKKKIAIWIINNNSDNYASIQNNVFSLYILTRDIRQN